MKKASILALAVLAATAGFAGSVSAQSALKDVLRVRDGIIHVGMAFEISERCDSLRPRTFRGLSFLNSLKNHARDLGFSDDEIDAYVNDDAEKDRLEGIARQQLTLLGADDANDASYCAVGRAQMEANTRVGWLLR
jgi:hypothetical protein